MLWAALLAAAWLNLILRRKTSHYTVALYPSPLREVCVMCELIAPVYDHWALLQAGLDVQM